MTAATQNTGMIRFWSLRDTGPCGSMASWGRVVREHAVKNRASTAVARARRRRPRVGRELRDVTRHPSCSDFVRIGRTTDGAAFRTGAGRDKSTGPLEAGEQDTEVAGAQRAGVLGHDAPAGGDEEGGGHAP